MEYERKLNVRWQSWDHHRGGWAYAQTWLQRCLGDPGGVTCFGSVEDQVTGPRLAPESPWVGFLHFPPYIPEGWCLERHLGGAWQELDLDRHCCGLFTLSRYAADYARLWVGCPVEAVPHPVEAAEPLWSPERLEAARTPAGLRLLTIGCNLRDYQLLYALAAPGWHKCLLDGAGAEYDHFRHGRQRCRLDAPVDVIPWMPDSDYDRLLSESVVLLPLKDASACNTLLECLVRGTPLLTPPVGGSVEYLGADYPLFYRSPQEAERFLADFPRVLAAHQHLKWLHKGDAGTLGGAAFARSVAETTIYRRL